MVASSPVIPLESAHRPCTVVAHPAVLGAAHPSGYKLIPLTMSVSLSAYDQESPLTKREQDLQALVRDIMDASGISQAATRD